MTRRLKLLTSLSTLTAASALALTGCGGEGEGAEGEGAAGGVSPSLSAEGEGEGGEGEGEGEGASGADPATDDVEYLHRLGQVRGHLVAFIELHRIGAHEMSATHAKHPESELYADLVPAFAARNKPGFADELNALVTAMENDGDIDGAYEAVKAAIDANEPGVDVATRLMSIATIARTAGDEFVIGVAESGEITNAHEYQDAYGFLTAARETLLKVEAYTQAEREAIATVDEQLAIALDEFDDLTATQIDGKSSVIYSAAARIEIAALGLS
ncbi:MAG: hypothetical protein AAGD92_04030 [Pseudomonadota bacterium]